MLEDFFIYFLGFPPDGFEWIPYILSAIVFLTVYRLILDLFKLVFKLSKIKF